MNSFRDIFNNSPNGLKDIVRSHWHAKQNTTYHPEGNTLKHIITVVNRAIHNYPNNPNMILAAYFHDLGKMETYNFKDGKHTAHGHEKVSDRLVQDYSSFIEEMGGDPKIVSYIVSNHMKMKSHVWDVMRDKKKEKITDHPNFDDLDGFSKIDKGGLHLESVIRKILKEEIDKDWDFMDDIPTNPYEGVRTGSDYMQVWDELAYEFQEACVKIKDGYVISNDYDGTIDIELTLPESETQPRGGRIKVWMNVVEISEENEWIMDCSFTMYSEDNFEYEEVVINKTGRFYSGGMGTIMEPIIKEIKKLKPYFCEESN